MTSTSELIAGLSDPRAYPVPCDRVEVRQTHASVLFFAGHRVYKVKKAVNLGFLDFSSLPRRLFYCREELRLNRRLAPDVYLAVVAIRRRADGRLRIAGGEGDGPVIEYAVEMRRLPEDRMLDRMLDAGAIDDAILDDLTDRLVRFHREAPTGPGVDEHGAADAVAAMVLGNLQEAQRFGVPAGTLSQPMHAHLERAARGFLEARRELLEARVAARRIREGHGDLHAGNICMTPEGIVIYDCIEFSPRLRCGDVAKDLAFLVMDLDERGYRGSGRYVARRYAMQAEDHELEALLPFYKAHLACVRGKVNAITATDAGIEQPLRADARRASIRYFCLAAAYGLPPVLVLMCGLPGSGKSWLADRIARPLDAAVIRSDVMRKRLAGIPLTHHPTGPDAEALYSPQVSHRTYQAMVQEAESLLAGGRSVVVDATFPQRSSRETFTRLAQARQAPFVVVHVTAPEPVIAQRLHRRPEIPDEVSDADWAVYQQFKSRFEPPREIPRAQLVEAQSPGEAEPVVAEVVERLLEQSHAASI